MRGTTARQLLKVPLRSTSITRRHSSTGYSQGGGWAGDAGARDQDVQAAGGAESGFGSTGNIGRIGHIDARGLRAGDPGGCSGERALVAIPQEDTAAFGGYAGGGLPADA